MSFRRRHLQPGDSSTLLIEQIPDFVGALEYNTVAYSLALAGEVVRAEEYYRRAIGVTKSPFERATAQRSFAGFLFTRGRFDEARALYQDSLAQLPAQAPSSRQLNGYTLQGWAWNEAFLARDAARADRLFAEAQREFEQVENAVMRYQLLNGLAAAQSSSPHGAPQRPPRRARVRLVWNKSGFLSACAG